jgi:CubicO group peptidase (beta-lactamase class C family)
MAMNGSSARAAPRRWFAGACLAVLAGLAQACGSSRVPASTDARSTSAAQVFPDTGWERIADPTSVGYTRAGLDRVHSMLSAMNTTGMVVVVGGRVLLEHGDIDTLSYLASARKSVLSMLYGKYVANGTIRLDETLRDLGLDDRGEAGPLLPQERAATVEHLLMARSGIYHPASNPGDNLADAPPRGSQKPGAYYLYSNWDFNALGTIFEQKVGRGIYDALETDIARPIGMQDWNRAIHRRTGDTTRSIHLAYHMTFSTRDMARIGYLMLRDGQWRGTQVIPRDWVERSVRPWTRVTDMNPPPLRNQRAGYGYLWWIWDGREPRDVFDGGYSARGAYGQYIAVIPRLDMVVAHKVAVPPEKNVSMAEFERVLDALVAARCAKVPTSTVCP